MRGADRDDTRDGKVVGEPFQTGDIARSLHGAVDAETLRLSSSKKVSLKTDSSYDARMTDESELPPMTSMDYIVHLSHKHPSFAVMKAKRLRKNNNFMLTGISLRHPGPITCKVLR